MNTGRLRRRAGRRHTGTGAVRTLPAFAAIAGACVGMADVAINPEGGGWSVRTQAYSARVDANGYVKSIAHAEDEFMAPKGKTPGGFYLCMDGVPPLTDVQCTGSVVQGGNRLGSLSWHFEDGSIRCTVTCRNGKGVAFYGILAPGVENVLVSRGDLRPTPASASSGRVLWFRGDSVLETVGGNRIWGPWKEHQVWEARLRKGEKRTVVIIPRRKTDADAAKCEPVPTIAFDVSGAHSNPAQIPICMIGDSITWWNHGDTWRQYLLGHMPTLAFVGTHSARLGYSHAGEGGNSVDAVIGRVRNIPDCAYYSLLIGTNNNNVRDLEETQPRAAKTAEKIGQLVALLLAKPSVKAVFLCSILPCHTDNPLRDRTNSAANAVLRQRLRDGVFPPDKVVWVEYEEPIRAMDGWEPMIKLHPEPDGYRVLARILAERIRATLGLPQPPFTPTPSPGAGVRVWNLWDDALGETAVPLIAGHYTLSFDVVGVADGNAAVVVQTADPAVEQGVLRHHVAVTAAQAGTRAHASFYTGEEGYGYTRATVTVRAEGCDVRHMLLEKMRPSKKPSVFGRGIYIDTETPPSPGELIERAR